MPLSPGQLINNRYRIVKLLGQGGFGAVYRAWDLNIEASCALKENLDTSPEIKEQFRREAVILANLQHPNLPRVRDHFDIPGQGQYLVMDFVMGDDLQGILDSEGAPLPESRVLPWIDQVCDALIYLHEQTPPVIHRDIKPANIKITPPGKVMVVDFGIAKVYDPNMKTTVGARAITRGYSPIEQYGRGITDARSDVYALGATLYALLTGQEPPESIQINLGTALIPPRRLNPLISPNTELVIEKAMQLTPNNRYPNASVMKASLHPVLPAIQVAKTTAPISAYTQPRVEKKQVAPKPDTRPGPESRVNPDTRPKRTIPRGLLIIAILGLVVVGLCVCLGLYWLSWQDVGKLFGISMSALRWISGNWL
jgi:serine/threonine protein kinase